MTALEALELWRLFFVSGFVFLICVGVWAIIVITRMRQQQAVAMTMLRAFSAKLGLDGKPLNGMKG